MHEITVISGKGGAGKTSITAALASVAENCMICDCDVDAADLHLITQPKLIESFPFEGAWLAEIDQNKCTFCGICEEFCRFDTIENKGFEFKVNPISCEGCRLCERVCPSGAITSKRSDVNSYQVSSSRLGYLVDAKMFPGEENSGKLVSVVREKAREIAQQNNIEFIINDGPPGIGCSSIASLSNVSKVLLVIEASVSGFHDAKRLLSLLENSNTEVYILINKANLNNELCEQIRKTCSENEHKILGEIPFSKTFLKAMEHNQSIAEFDKEYQTLFHEIWNKLSN